MRRPALALVLLALAAGCAGENGDDGGTPIMTREPPPATGTTTPAPTRPALEEVVGGLESPVHVAAAPGEPGRLYVVEQAGRIRVVEDGQVRAEPFLDLTDRVRSGGERGLLSVAFHPDYAENGRLFVDYTNRDGDTRVVELRASGGQADPGSARELLAVEQPFANHNGGQLAFGPDGLLYVGMGDGGSGGDPLGNAQNLGSRLGKLLRLDVDEPGARWEIAAYGLRNPWRFSFDRETGALLLADVGQDAREEVNYLPWPASGLVNFGWPAWEGDRRYDDRPLDRAGPLVQPVSTYGRGRGCSVTGGFVYRGAELSGVQGRAFFGDWCSGTVWSFDTASPADTLRAEGFRVPALTSFGEDEDGELYLVSQKGSLYRLAAAR
jgi:glucose/arabinose dehydrogenase